MNSYDEEAKKNHDDIMKKDINLLTNVELRMSKNFYENGFERFQYGYGVVTEEFEEVHEELDLVEYMMGSTWLSIRERDEDGVRERIKVLDETCQKLIHEAIQLAAMVRKWGECSEI